MSNSGTRVLVIGSKGQVSRTLIESLPRHGFQVSVASRPTIDLADLPNLGPTIRAAHPHVVINAAAYTAVDRAEDEPGLAMAINGDGAGAVALEAHKAGAAIIHFSTDYVFDGSKPSPYLETDVTNPIGVYGLSKLAGEIAVAAANPRHVILRTAWVCSPYGANFVKSMLRLASKRLELRVVDDQRGAPTFAVDIAEAVARIVATIKPRKDSGRHARFGVFHLTNRGETSWCGFARAIMEASAVRGGQSAPVTPIATKDYPTKAKRPAYSTLCNDKIADVYGVAMPDWQSSMARCLDALFAPTGENAEVVV